MQQTASRHRHGRTNDMEVKLEAQRQRVGVAAGAAWLSVVLLLAAGKQGEKKIKINI